MEGRKSKVTMHSSVYSFNMQVYALQRVLKENEWQNLFITEKKADITDLFTTQECMYYFIVSTVNEQCYAT